MGKDALVSKTLKTFEKNFGDFEFFRRHPSALRIGTRITQA
jgi:hypothetical protein